MLTILCSHQALQTKNLLINYNLQGSTYSMLWIILWIQLRTKIGNKGIQISNKEMLIRIRLFAVVKILKHQSPQPLIRNTVKIIHMQGKNSKTNIFKFWRTSKNCNKTCKSQTRITFINNKNRIVLFNKTSNNLTSVLSYKPIRHSNRAEANLRKKMMKIY